jgi:hypothetical protein
MTMLLQMSMLSPSRICAAIDSKSTQRLASISNMPKRPNEHAGSFEQSTSK